MTFSVGDVVMLPFFKHQEDNEGEARSAIIVEDLQDEFYLIGTTTRLHQLQNYPDGFIITKTSADGIQMGLTGDSIIACGVVGIRKEVKLKKTFFYKPKLMIKLGTCTEEMLNKIIRLCP